MKKLILIALTSVAFCPVVANAQSIPIVIEAWSGDRVTSTSTQTYEEVIERAAEQACEKPFLRNLKGQQVYAACLEESRAEAEAILAERIAAPATELAMR